MNIKQILSQEGIQWASRMDCPRCKGEKKITASESKGIAKCWKCNTVWTEKGAGAEATWANTLIRALAERCQQHLENSIPAFTWLLEKRSLPEDIGWLLAHDLGAIPKNINAAGLAAEALDNLKAERQSAVDACETEKQALKIEERYCQEEQRLQKFTETLIKLDDKMWTDAVVYIYTDANGNPISLNVRQQKLETGDGEKHCMRIQPKIGQRGLFCPVETAGAEWGGKLPKIIVEGEHNWLSLLRRADDWGAGYELAGFAMGGKNGADRNAAKQLLGSEKPLVIYDNDTLSERTNRQGGWDLVEALSWRFSLNATTTLLKDADDWVNSTTVMPHHLLELAKDAEFVPRPYEAVAEDITNIRCDKMPEFMKAKLITQGEFGELWRARFKNNDELNYRFVHRGCGIRASEANKEIRWFMNKDFRLALLRDWKENTPEKVLDFTRYDLPAREPGERGRNWSLMNRINQKGTRPQDKPVPLSALPAEDRAFIARRHPEIMA